MSVDYANRFKMISLDEQYTLIGIIILDKIIKKKRLFSTLLEGDDTHLDPVFSFLLSNHVVNIDEEIGGYIITPKGKKVYKEFLKRYEEYLRIYDIFCAVDLEEGVFAFERIFDYQDSVFHDYVNDERFTDVRVSVCEYKKMNVWEIVFISFLIEKRFREPKDREHILGQDSWQYKVISGEIFEEIQEILNSSPHFEELGFEDEEGTVPGEDVIQDIIRQGVELARNINQQEHENRQQDEQERQSRFSSNNYDNDVEEVTTTTYTSYDPYWYDPWYDPLYVSPVWEIGLLGLILL